MKPVEEAFASETFRRVILPGIVLAAGIHPLVAGWAPLIDSLYGVSSTVMFVAEIVFFGLIVSSATQSIYYIYEGFRLRKLTALADRLNKRRLKRLIKSMDTLQSPSQENERLKTYEALRGFPDCRRSDGSVEYYADRPTRLGNVIATYELYPKTRYGVDGIYYWFHLLNLAPENARKDFSDQCVFAESLVLASFSGALVALLHAVVLIGFGIGMCSQRLVFVILKVGPKTSISLLVFGILAWVLFYRAALGAHDEAGKIFRSIVDIVMPCFVRWLMKAKAPLDAATAQQLQRVTESLRFW